MTDFEDEPMGEVISFPSRDEDDERANALPVRRVPWPQDKKCEGGHRRAWVAAEARKVTCRDCGAELDPFDFLLKLTEKPEQITRTIKDLRGRKEYLARSVEELTRQERNAKSRVRRWQAKAGGLLDLSDRGRVESSIAGALKMAVDAHGPITRANVSSAAKRVVSNLKGIARGEQ